MAEATDSNNKPTEKKASARMLSEVGQPGLITHNSFVNELAEKDLKVPNLYFTIDQMALHSAISEPLNLTVALETNAITDGVYEGTGSRLSQAIADWGNYIIHNMKHQSWYECAQNINTHIKYGYSLNEISASRAKSGKYKGDMVLDHLGPRSPKSIYAIIWDQYKRNVTHFVQQPLSEADFKLKQGNARFLGEYRQGGAFSVSSEFGKYPVMNKARLLHNVYNGSMGNPQGCSPLLAAYKPWRELSVIGEYEVIGVARNFGGTPVARVPDELLLRGNDPLNYPDDAKALKEIQDDLENAHAGKQAFFLLPSSVADGKYEWSIELLGIQGTGAGFDTDAMIKRKQTEIYNAFNAGHLILGQNGNTTSYSAAEHGTATHATIVERDLKGTSVMLQRMLGQLLDAQGFEYDRKDLPRFRPASFDQLSLDELGKFIQRTMSVSGMTPEMMETLLKWGNLPSTGLDMIDFYAKRESGAGKGMGTSGTGTSNQSNSDTNLENKSMYKQPDNVFKGDDGKLYDLDTCEPYTFTREHND